MTDTTTTTGSAEGEAVDARYRDASLPVADRVEILLSQMTLEEKAGLFFQTMIAIGEGGELGGVDPMFGLPSTEEYVLGRGMTHFNVLGAAPTGREMAEWHNRLQELAADDPPRHPRHALDRPAALFSDNPGAAIMAGPFSQWPETIGLGRARRRGARRAVRRHRPPGVHWPSASASRCTRRSTWPPSRAGRGRSATFGEDADLSGGWSPPTSAGSRATELGPDSVAT